MTTSTTSTTNTSGTSHPDAANPEIGSSVAAGDIVTNYHDMGSVTDDDPPILFLHGSGPGVSAWANWRLNLPALAAEFRTVAPDIVGFGFTTRPAGITYDLATWKSHLGDFLDALGLGRVHLVGNSFGGALALAFAVEFPERVERLVLMGSAGLSFPITPALDRIWGYEPTLERMRELLDLMAYDRSLVNDDIADLRYRASMREDIQEAYAAMFPEPRQASLDALATSEDAIRGLPHEALVLHGRDDRIVPVESSYRLSNLIDRSQLHVLGRCGHWTQIEQAGRFNRLVTDFFREARG